MKCLHCAVEYFPNWNKGGIKPGSSSETEAAEDEFIRSGPFLETAWMWSAAKCPACYNPTITIDLIDVDDPREPLIHSQAYPQYPSREFAVDAVPEAFKADYVEACKVLPVSAKASAALSRRILEAILSEQGYTGKDLFQQVGSVLKEESPAKSLPLSIRQTIDAVRNLGNFAAHQTTDKAGPQVIDVDHDEAEWCLEIIEALFVHYYHTPSTRDRRRVANLSAKLANANKPSRLGKTALRSRITRSWNWEAGLQAESRAISQNAMC